MKKPKPTPLIEFLKRMADKLESGEWELYGNYTLSASSKNQNPVSFLSHEFPTRYLFDVQIKAKKDQPET